MEGQDEEFIKGANTGYLLSKYDPDLLKMLLKQKNVGSEYMEGMQFGRQEHERELFQENLAKSRAINQGPKKGPRLN